MVAARVAAAVAAPDGAALAAAELAGAALAGAELAGAALAGADPNGLAWVAAAPLPEPVPVVAAVPPQAANNAAAAVPTNPPSRARLERTFRSLTTSLLPCTLSPTDSLFYHLPDAGGHDYPHAVRQTIRLLDKRTIASDEYVRQSLV